MKVAIDVQHGGKPGRPSDRGAVSAPHEEYQLATWYALEADRRLRALGHECLWVGAGDYAERWRRADDWQAGVYLACHVNAGGRGRDGALLFYDHRSTRGSALAQQVAAQMAPLVGWACEARACRPDTNGTPRDADYSEAFGTIAGVQAVALCLEPFFIDGAQAGRRLALDADRVALCRAVGVAVAEGVHLWTS